MDAVVGHEEQRAAERAMPVVCGCDAPQIARTDVPDEHRAGGRAVGLSELLTVRDRDRVEEEERARRPQTLRQIVGTLRLVDVVHERRGPSVRRDQR